MNCFRRMSHCARIALCFIPCCRCFVSYVDAQLVLMRKRKRQKTLQTVWRELYGKIHSSFSSVNISYWFDFGSLIGLARENGVLVHDEDVDCCVSPNTDMKGVFQALVDNGFSFVRGYASNKDVTEMTFDYKGVGVDVFKCHMIGDKLGHYVYQVTNDLKTCKPIRIISHERIRPIVTKIVERDFGEGDSVRVAIPENFDEILSASYGTWRIPDKTTDFCRRDIPSQYRDVVDGIEVLDLEGVKALLAL